MADVLFGNLPLGAHIAVFASASLVTWFAGARLTHRAKQISERTQVGKALVGALLLGGVASLPELVMAVTAASFGDAALALTTLLGGVPVTLAMVALCDAAVGPEPMARVLGASSLVATATVGAGYALAVSAEGIATRTGLGSNVVGMVLGGVATSLPELSTIYAATKLRQYEMAFGDAFGSNLLSVALIYPVDLVYEHSPILNEVSVSAIVAVLLGISSTAIYVAGLLERSRITVMRVGLDSLFALILYAAGILLISRLG